MRLRLAGEIVALSGWSRAVREYSHLEQLWPGMELAGWIARTLSMTNSGWGYRAESLTKTGLRRIYRPRLAGLGVVACTRLIDVVPVGLFSWANDQLGTR